MKANKNEARKIAHEFAALLLERAFKRGDLLVYLREAYGATAESQPASVNNVRAAFDFVISNEWCKSMRFPSNRAKENLPQMTRAAVVFESLFPIARSTDERVEMARELERYLSRAEVHAAARKEKETTETADYRDAARAAVERGEMRTIDEVNCDPKCDPKPFPKTWPFNCICEMCGRPSKWKKYGCEFQQSPQQKTCSAFIEKENDRAKGGA